MDLAKLRSILRPLVLSLSTMPRHVDLPDFCSKLGLPSPDHGVSKRDRVTEAFDAMSDSDLQNTAELFLQHHPPSSRERNELQDLLWEDMPSPVINKRVRREIAQAVHVDDLYLSTDKFDDLIEGIWVLDDDPVALMGMFLGQRDPRSLRTQIMRHVYQNPGDWNTQDIFENIGAFEGSDRRFCLFLEGLASSEVRPKEESQRAFVEAVNKPLASCGLELRETDSIDGYPHFTLVYTHGAAAGRPKNLIFASQVKPDLRFRDAINNDVEIVTNADKVLVYDRPIGADGIRWDALQAWWAELNGIPDDHAATRSLYLRLRESLPKNSPPQLLLFKSFFEHFKETFPRLPALLPEVWLHWDPKTIQQRGRDALLRFRMDFLLLMPGDVRVVVEVDGKQHYSDESGNSSPSKYAEMAAADRELKLAGYHVYRFGAYELSEHSTVPAVFFDSLFKRFKVQA